MSIRSRLKQILYYFKLAYWNAKGIQHHFAIERTVNNLRSRRNLSASKNKNQKTKIAFVTTWYGKDISGGAETECYLLSHGLAGQYPDLDIAVLTTTLEDFSTDWNRIVHKQGIETDGLISVHRFDPLTPDRKLWSMLNHLKLSTGNTDALFKTMSSPMTVAEEAYFIKHMMYAPSLFQHLASNYHHFDFFIFIPYMFAPTAVGARIVREKSIIIPCLHNERHAFQRTYKKIMENSCANLFHVKAEKRLAEQIFKLEPKRQILLGEQVDNRPSQGIGQRFTEKYKIKTPYILFAGRKTEGKNLRLLVDFFRRFRTESGTVNLVILGKGELNYPNEPQIHDVGFVSVQDKYDAMAGALALVQPSTNESFSIVMMESWLQETPVIVSGHCEVTKDHCDDSGGGFYFFNYDDFRRHLLVLLENPQLRTSMALKGKKYVVENYSPEKILTKFHSVLLSLSARQPAFNGPPE